MLDLSEFRKDVAAAEGAEDSALLLLAGFNQKLLDLNNAQAAAGVEDQSALDALRAELATHTAALAQAVAQNPLPPNNPPSESPATDAAPHEQTAPGANDAMAGPVPDAPAKGKKGSQ